MLEQRCSSGRVNVIFVGADLKLVEKCSGYMAPEYAMGGVFSVKSDVYSFGVLVLEILSGQRNGAMYLQEHQHTLIQDVRNCMALHENRSRNAEFSPSRLNIF